MVFSILRPLDPVDDDIGFLQALFQIGAVGDHEAYIGQIFLRLQHHIHVYIQNTDLVAHAAGKLRNAGADVAAAQAGNDRPLHAGYISQQLAGTTVDGLHIMQRCQKTSLAGQLAHGAQQRETTVLVGHILIGHRGRMAVQQTVCFGRVRVGVNVGKKDLILCHPLKFLREQLLHLIVDVGLSPYRVRVRDDRSGGLILCIGKTAANSGSGLHIDRVAMARNFLHSGRHSGYPVFVFFDLLQNTDFHTNTPPKKYVTFLSTRLYTIRGVVSTSFVRIDCFSWL